MVRESRSNRLLELLSFLPDRDFRRCVERYGGDARPRGFSCWDQYLSMGFAQLTYRDSLRDIEACRRSLGGKLYHMGFHGRVSRSTLSDANDSHNWRIYADFAQVLVRHARPLYVSDPIGVELDQGLYALGFDHHRFVPFAVSVGEVAQEQRRGQDAYVARPAWQYPTFISITNGKVHDVNILDEISRRPARSTSWTAAMSISNASTSSRSALPSSSSARNPTFCSSAATRIRWTRPLAFDPISVRDAVKKCRAQARHHCVTRQTGAHAEAEKLRCARIGTSR
jgi:hypothetical protein